MAGRGRGKTEFSSCQKLQCHFENNLAQMVLLKQSFRFMVGLGHCPMISKYGPSLSKAVGPVDPSFLVVKKSRYNKKIIHLTASLHNVHVGCQYSKSCLKQPLKKKTKQRS